VPDEPSWPPAQTETVSDAEKLLYEAKLEYHKELAKAEQAERLEEFKAQNAELLAELEGR
jgi:hypothetical protein